jgi:hypothetical protein
VILPRAPAQSPDPIPVRSGSVAVAGSTGPDWPPRAGRRRPQRQQCLAPTPPEPDRTRLRQRGPTLPSFPSSLIHGRSHARVVDCGSAFTPHLPSPACESREICLASMSYPRPLPARPLAASPSFQSGVDPAREPEQRPVRHTSAQDKVRTRRRSEVGTRAGRTTGRARDAEAFWQGVRGPGTPPS